MLLQRNATSAPGAVARSHDACGGTLEWLMPADAGTRFACDVETPVNEGVLLLTRLFDSPEAFRRSWVLAEVAAKLLDIPILEWLHRHRSGSTPAFPAAAQALVVQTAAGNRTLAFGRMPAKPAAGLRPQHRGGLSWAEFCSARVVYLGNTGSATVPSGAARMEVLSACSESRCWQ